MKIHRSGRRAAAGVVVAATVSALLAAAGSATTTTDLVCGQVITQSVRLTADMFCDSDGLLVAANGVTVDLNGHTITGNGPGYGVQSDRAGTVVTNGTITTFSQGVHFTGTGDRAQNLRLTEDGIGVGLAGSTKAVVSGNYALGDGGFGISVYQGSGNQVVGNWVEETGPGSAADGIQVDTSTSITISGNKLLNNGANGIHVVGSTGTVTGNVANGNTTNGISLDNVGTGVKSGLTVSKNRASFNGDYGVNSTPGGSSDGGGDVVQDNGNAAQCLNVVCVEVAD